MVGGGRQAGRPCGGQQMVHRDWTQVPRFSRSHPLPPSGAVSFTESYTVSCTVQTFSFSMWSAFSFPLWFWSTRNYSGIGYFAIIRCSPMFLLLLLWFQGILCRIPVLVDLGLREQSVYSWRACTFCWTVFPGDPEVCRVFYLSWDWSDKVQAGHRVSALYVNWPVLCCWGLKDHDNAFSTKCQKIFESVYSSTPFSLLVSCSFVIISSVTRL